MERGQHCTRKRNGNINIIQLASNVIDYTIILELYNFTNNNHHLKAIGQKLKAIFTLNVHCFAGCRQQSDYTLLRKQYPMFELPDAAMLLMEDVSLMAINRGVTTRGRDKTTLQALCKGQQIFLRKPQDIRIGSCFGSKGGSLGKEAQKYCQLDAKAALFLHQQYSSFPDLTM